MTMLRNGWMVASVMALAMASAGAQTVARGSSTSGSMTMMASGGQSGTTSPVKDDLFAGTEVFAKGASDVTEITMDPDTLGMVGGRASSRAHNMVLNVVRTYTYDKPGMYRMEDVEAFRNKLNTGDWHCSVHTRSLKSGDSTDVCNKRRSDDMVESAIITVEPKELTFIHTIRKRGAGESDVMPMGMPLSMGIGPEMRANALVARAEMQANMAEMRANMAASGMYGGGSIHMQLMEPSQALDVLKSLDKVDVKELLKLKVHVDGWDVEGPVPPTPAVAPMAPLTPGAPPAQVPPSPPSIPHL